MSENYEEKERFDGKKVKILMPEYAPTVEEDNYPWRKNINSVNIGEQADPVKKYLTTAERYFYSTEWFGSEKRKNPA
jgi:hypothetical protein